MYIYFLFSFEHNYIKIGKTIQPHKRFKKLQKENVPFDLYMIVVKNPSISESELHNKYFYCHKTREWFIGNKELHKHIEELYDLYNGIIISDKLCEEKLYKQFISAKQRDKRVGLIMEMLRQKEKQKEKTLAIKEKLKGYISNL